MVEVPEDLRDRPFAVDTPSGNHDVGYDILQCDENSVTWAAYDHMHYATPDGEPEVDEDAGTITFFLDGEEIVFRPFVSNDALWLMNTVVPLPVGELYDYASTKLGT